MEDDRIMLLFCFNTLSVKTDAVDAEIKIVISRI